MRAAFSWLLYGVLPVLTSCSAAGVARSRPPAECQGSAGAVLRSVGLDRLSAHIPHVIARSQSRDFGGTVCFAQALRLALASLLGDASNLESPGAVVGTGCLVCEVDQPGTELRLVARGDPGPEGGETLSRHWVFELSMPHVSDHVYWAVVPRWPDERGEVHVYNYGFN